MKLLRNMPIGIFVLLIVGILMGEIAAMENIKKTVNAMMRKMTGKKEENRLIGGRNASVDVENGLTAKSKHAEYAFIYAKFPFKFSSKKKIQYYELKVNKPGSIGFGFSGADGSFKYDDSGKLSIRGINYPQFGTKFNNAGDTMGCGIYRAKKNQIYAFFTNGGEINDKLISIYNRHEELCPKIVLAGSGGTEVTANFKVDTAKFEKELENLMQKESNNDDNVYGF